MLVVSNDRVADRDERSSGIWREKAEGIFNRVSCKIGQYIISQCLKALGKCGSPGVFVKEIHDSVFGCLN